MFTDSRHFLAGADVGAGLIAMPLAAGTASAAPMSFGDNISGIAGAIASYGDTGFLEKSKLMVSEGRAMILDAVGTAGLTALPSQTNFVYVKVPDADEVQAAMKARNIAIRGAYGPWTQYSRVSTGKIEDVARYATALPEVIDSLFG